MGMILTDEQQAILDGSRGETMAKVMKTLVMFGEAFHAEKMVPVTSRYNHLVTSFGLGVLQPVYDLMQQLIDAALHVQDGSRAARAHAPLHRVERDGGIQAERERFHEPMAVHAPYVRKTRLCPQQLGARLDGGCRQQLLQPLCRQQPALHGAYSGGQEQIVRVLSPFCQRDAPFQSNSTAATAEESSCRARRSSSAKPQLISMRPRCSTTPPPVSRVSAARVKPAPGFLPLAASTTA